jgi:plastocyanin
MPIPKVLFAIPLLAAGAFLPAAGADPPHEPSGTVGMAHETFTINEITVHVGETLTFVNNSRWLHIIGPGQEGTLFTQNGNPMDHRVLTQINDKYTTAKWEQPGTYYMTCSIHPEMTVKVTVVN